MSVTFKKKGEGRAGEGGAPEPSAPSAVDSTRSSMTERSPEDESFSAKKVKGVYGVDYSRREGARAGSGRGAVVPEG